MFSSSPSSFSIFLLLLFPVISAIADKIPMVQIYNQIGGFGKI
jgi:hypothetical protein